jgi:competence protein ComEC
MGPNRSRFAGIQWIKTPGHRRPALWAAVLIAGGILLARNIPLIPWAWASLLVVALALVFAMRQRSPAAAYWAAVTVCVAIGAFRYATVAQWLPSHHIVRHIPTARYVEIFGRVVDLPERRDRSIHLVLDVRSIKIDSRQNAVTGRLLVKVFDTTRRFAYGDFLRFSGKLERPSEARNPGGFNYRQFLADRGIEGMVSVAKHRPVRVYPAPGGHIFYNRLIIPLREYILEQFRRYVPGTRGALLSGYLIGETREMPDWLYRAYRNSGTLHLLAVSGSNVWLVLGLFWLIFRRLRLPRLLQTVLLLSILVVFCFVTRNEPSVVRAGLMAALILVGHLLHRRIDILNILGVSAVIILLFAPRHLFLPGFQLSYAAVIGIVLVVPRIQQLIPALARRPAGKWSLSLVASSIAATAATAPILAIHFGTVPVISVVSNLVMIPLAGVITYCSIVLLMLGDLWPWAARSVAWVAEMSAAWSITAARFFETVPLHRLSWPEPGLFGLCNYLLILIAFVSSRRWFRWIRFAIFYFLAFGAVVVIRHIVLPRPPAGEIVFLDCAEEPLVGIILPDDSPRFVGTSGAFSPANVQWVIDPYIVKAGLIRETLIYDTLDAEAVSLSGSWLNHPSALFFDGKPHYYNETIKHRRFCLGSPDQSLCLAADYIQSPWMRVLIVYISDSHIAQLALDMLVDKHLDVLALRSGPPSADFCAALAGLSCRRLILFSISSRYAGSAFREAWARHLPDWTVWSTGANGGIRIPLCSCSVPICTIG